MAALSAQDIKILEQTRQRLAQLTSSLSNLQSQIGTSDPLPPWYTLHRLLLAVLDSQIVDSANTLNRTSLHTSTQILAQSLLSLSTQLESQSALLASTAVYPVPSYPGREMEGLLGQLLRKKLEPSVEDWVDRGQQVGEQVIGADGEEWKELWEWAAVRGNELAREHEWGGEDGSEEEPVIIGEGEKDGENDQMQGIEEEKRKTEGKAISIDAVLRFVSKGEEPQG